MNAHKCTDTILAQALATDVSFTWSDWINAGKRLLIGEIAKVVPMVRVWNHRAKSRRQLAKLNAVLLDDIGLSAEQAHIECAKPFWVD